MQNFSSGAHVAEARERVAALEEQTRKEADEKAWADAQRTGTTAAFTDYVQKFASGAHVAEARQRIAALEEQVRKEEDEKAWADAQRSGTATAFTNYVQKFGSGAHVAEARQRAAALDTQGRKEVPGIDIQNTCKAAAGAMVSLMGGTTTEQDINACLDSEQKARDQIFKDRATYSRRRQEAVHANGTSTCRATWNGSPASRWSGTCERWTADRSSGRVPGRCRR